MNRRSFLKFLPLLGVAPTLASKVVTSLGERKPVSVGARYMSMSDLVRETWATDFGLIEYEEGRISPFISRTKGR